MPYSPRVVPFDFSGLFTRPPRATLALMIVTGIVSLLVMSGAEDLSAIAPARLLLDFAPSQLWQSYRFWTPFTYLFISSHPIQLFTCEVIGLWMFGARLENIFGTARFLFFFFITGAGAALLTALLGLFVPPLKGVPPGVFQGAWVALASIILGWVLMNWDSTVYVLVVPVRAPFLLAIPLAIPLIHAFQGNWAPFLPVFTTMVIGYLLMYRGENPVIFFLEFIQEKWDERQYRRRARHLRIVPPPPPLPEDEEDPERPPQPPRYLP